MSDELQALSVLDAISANCRVTQRELSETTGLNLAKINFLLRRMADKGLVKLRNISKNPNKLKYLYVLTAGGMAEKSRLTIRFAKRTLVEYEKTIASVRRRLDDLKKSGVSRILLLGEGMVTDLVMDAARSVEGLDVVAIVARKSSGIRHGVKTVSSARGLNYDRAVPCDDTEIHSKQLLKQAGIPKEKLWLM
jgi:EPS-associated MarR family transcriptional regulator